jgi:autotransporter passenger strand-loop-strand repeat protein
MTITVSSGVTSTGLTISSGDPIVVLSGGSLEHSTILNGASATLSSGAGAIGLTVSAGGVVQGPGDLADARVAGSLSGVTINDPSDLGYVVELLSGGTASNVTVNRFGTFEILPGASAASTLIGNGAYVDVYGSAAGMQVGDFGDIDIFHGGVASGVDVELHGTLYLADGTASGVTVESGGAFWLGGGTVSDASVQSGGTLDLVGVLTSNITLTPSVTSTTVLSGVTVSSGGYLDLDFATIASGVTVSLGSGAVGAAETVDKGAVVLGPGVLDAGTVSGALSGVGVAGFVEIASGGSASGVTVVAYTAPVDDNILQVDSGATVTGTLLQNQTALYVYGSASGTTVGSGGDEYDYGSASDDVVQSGGVLTLAGVASEETVLSGGTLAFNGRLTSSLVLGSAATTRTLDGVTVSSGGAIDFGNVTVAGAATTVSLGGTATGDLTVSSGAVVQGPGFAPFLDVLSGGAVGGLTVGNSTIESGASATDMTIGGAVGGYGARQTVYGSATGDTVLSAGLLYLESGGSATDERVQSGGTVFFGEDVTNNFTETAGAVTGTTVLAGVTISSGGDVILSGATVVSGVTLTLAAGAVADGVTVSSGGSLLGPGVLSGSSYVAGSVSGVAVGAGYKGPIYLELLSGGTASAVTVSGLSDAMQIDAGASATGTVVVGDARLGVFGSATATDIEASLETVYAGGLASGDLVSNGGRLYVSAGGVASGATVRSGGIEEALGTDDGGVVSGGGALVVLVGGLASGTTLRGGGERVLGTESAGVVSNGGVDVVTSGGAADGTTVLDGGRLYLLAGTSTDAQVSAGGKALISSGGVASATAVTSGGLEYVFAGGLASGAAVSNGGDELISSGGVADATMVSSGGLARVLSGGAASGSVVQSGAKQVVYAGGDAFAATIQSGAVEYALSGATTFTTVVSSGGTEAISSGALAIGLSLRSGGVLADDGEMRFAGAGALGGRLLGSGAIVQTEVGDLVIGGVGGNFTGRAAIEAGTIELASAGALGTGSVQFVAPSAGSAVLQIDAADAPAAGGTFANKIENFDATGEDIDLRSIAFVAGATATLTGGKLVLSDGGKTYTFNVAGGTAGMYPVLSDGAGGTLIDPKVTAFAQAAAAFIPSSGASPLAGSPTSHTTLAHAMSLAPPGRA